MSVISFATNRTARAAATARHFAGKYASTFLTELALCTRTSSVVGLLCFQLAAVAPLLRLGDSFAIGVAVLTLTAARLQVDAVNLMRGKELLSHSETEWQKITQFAAAMQLLQIPLGLLTIVKLLVH